MAHVVCLGLVTVDAIFRVAALPGEGSKARADAAQIVAGGGALYAASAIAALGGRASLVSALGDDMPADLVRATLARRGIDATWLAPRPGLDTPHSAVLISGRGERTIVNHRDDALFADPPARLPPTFDAALADTRWPRGAAALMAAARAAGKPGVIDAESPVAPALDALHAASHVVFSQQGLRDHAGACGAAALARVAQRLGAWVAVTRGAQPLLWHHRGTAGTVEGFSVAPIDTLGAGDTWHGAFALALARALPEGAAARHASAAAAIKVARPPGGWATAAEVAALLAGP